MVGETYGTYAVKKPKISDKQLLQDINQQFGTNFSQDDRVFIQQNSAHYLTDSWSDRISGRIENQRIETGFLKQYFDWDAKIIARISVS